jgi:hypothetical protein
VVDGVGGGATWVLVRTTRAAPAAADEGLMVWHVGRPHCSRCIGDASKSGSRVQCSGNTTGWKVAQLQHGGLALLAALHVGWGQSTFHCLGYQYITALDKVVDAMLRWLCSCCRRANGSAASGRQQALTSSTSLPADGSVLGSALLMRCNCEGGHTMDEGIAFDRVDINEMLAAPTAVCKGCGVAAAVGTGPYQPAHACWCVLTAAAPA